MPDVSIRFEILLASVGSMEDELPVFGRMFSKKFLKEFCSLVVIGSGCCWSY